MMNDESEPPINELPLSFLVIIHHSSFLSLASGAPHGASLSSVAE
jgi:hypothetical protein